MFKGFSLCSHVIAAAEDNGDLRSFLDNVTFHAPYRLAKEGRCTLHWAQTGGWADIRVASLLHFNAQYFSERHKSHAE